MRRRWLVLLLVAMGFAATRLTPTVTGGAPPVDHVAAGRQAKQQGDLPRAVGELRRAVAHDAANLEAHWCLAWVLSAQRDLAGAAAAFRRVIDLSPGTLYAAEASAAIQRLEAATIGARNMLPSTARARRDARPVANLRGTVESLSPGTGRLVLTVQSLAWPGYGFHALPARATLLLGTFGRGPRLLGLADRDLALDSVRVGDTVEVGLGPLRHGLWALRAVAKVDQRGQAVPWATLAAGNIPLYTEEAAQARVIVPMVFPVLGGASWHDTFLEPRPQGYHYGQDLAAPTMRPLLATFDGVVHLLKATASHPANTLMLVGDNGWQVLYTHLNDSTPGTNDHCRDPLYAFAPGLDDGARVLQGQLLGYNGMSGNATGPHCHFELRDNRYGDVYNARASLHMAQFLAAPRLNAVADNLRPAPGDVRLDGYLHDYDPARRVATLALASRRDVWGSAVVTQPQRRYVRCGQVPVRLLGAEALETPLDELPAGAYLAVLGHAEGGAVVATSLYAEAVGLCADAALTQALAGMAERR